MFLDTEAAFPYCNRSIKKSCVIWFGSSSVGIGAAYFVQGWFVSVLAKSSASSVLPLSIGTEASIELKFIEKCIAVGYKI